MNLRKFQTGNIIRILDGFEDILSQKAQAPPFDLFLKNYFKRNKSLGSKDRALITDHSYKLIRYKYYLDAISEKPLSWENRLKTLLSSKFEKNKNNDHLSKSVLCSCPEELFKILVKAYGEEKAFEYCVNMNEKAPITVRVNPLKISRDELFEKWKNADKFLVKKTVHSLFGITLMSTKNINLYDLPEFNRGYFEIQDEASQLAAFQIECQEGDQVLDYCAGSGGKSLAFSPFMKGKGQLYLHDTRERILEEAKKRFRRAGIENVQFHHEKDNILKLKGKADWLVLDVPCTGTGTLRRNPDLKWKFSRKNLDHLIELQRSIIDESLVYLKRNGRLVYITCSLLPEENLEQTNYLIRKYGMELVKGKYFQTFPEANGMDSFFSAVLKFK